MKKLLIFLPLILLTLFSCKKEEAPAIVYPCETQHFGAIKCINSTSYDLEVYLNGDYKGPVPANGTKSFYEIPSGLHSMFVERVGTNDYYSKEPTVKDCETLSVYF